MLSGVFVERQKKIISNNSGILKQLKLTLGVKEGQFMLIRLVNSTEEIQSRRFCFVNGANCMNGGLISK